ncbi:phosphoribosylamine--glycine ligase [Longispora sp. K20-0274]|uniref:phosphoribosylamine--glycine ligase n=1 Tax=Longispora sp. K20-0274 TaxID=3088255 RepID=UPI00399A60AC
MRVLVIGTGGREHALVTALSLDPAVSHVLAAPGNPGMAALAELRAVDPMDPAAVAALAVDTAADLVVVGPEAPLVAGVADAVRAAGVACFGPSFEAARLEGSKDFSKAVMVAAGVPTARSYTCDTPEQAAAALDEFGPTYVVKDDALAAGKGVVVTDDRDAALAHAASCGRVVIEEYLDGPEVSLFVVCHGLTGVPLLPAQDFKRIGDGDTGPNTGGMGAYAPLTWAPEDLVPTVMTQVVAPVLREMADRGTPFQGLLFVGLALTAKGPKVIEFNVRFGDPETQVVLPLLKSGLGGLLTAAATGTLAEHPPLEWRDGGSVAVVLASAGYPASSRSGDVITGADAPGVIHAGTALRADGALVTAGGRVLCCTAVADSVPEARAAAYRLVDKVRFDGAQHRTDIAQEK